jgi:UDP-N-acetylglucosamine 2-epimerase (non-hydrolysing)
MSPVDHHPQRRRRLRPIEGGRSAATADAPRQPTVLHVVVEQADRMRLDRLITAVSRWGVFHQVLVHLSLPAPGQMVADPADAIMLMGGRAERRESATAGSHVARIITEFERMLTMLHPRLVVLPGGRAESFACALAAAKRGVSLAEVDAGLRSGARDVPDRDRVLTDRLADILLVSSDDARRNLLDEGFSDSRIHVVGSTLVDAIRALETAARARAAWLDHNADAQDYVLVALGAIGPSRRLWAALAELAARTPVVALIEADRRRDRAGQALRAILAGSPARYAHAGPYLDRLSLACGAGAIVTDLPDLQEAASVLGVPCYTLAERTERTVTLSHGTNHLAGRLGSGLSAVHPLARPPVPCAVPLWDGHAAERAAEVLVAKNALRRQAGS